MDSLIEILCGIGFIGLGIYTFATRRFVWRNGESWSANPPETIVEGAPAMALSLLQMAAGVAILMPGSAIEQLYGLIEATTGIRIS